MLFVHYAIIGKLEERITCRLWSLLNMPMGLQLAHSFFFFLFILFFSNSISFSGKAFRGHFHFHHLRFFIQAQLQNERVIHDNSTSGDYVLPFFNAKIKCWWLQFLITWLRASHIVIIIVDTNLIHKITVPEFQYCNWKESALQC